MKKSKTPTISSPIEFLRAIFPINIKGWVRLVFVKEGKWPGDLRWLSVEEIHTLSNVETPEGYDCYFTPHTYKQRENAAKDKAGDFGCCLWMDSDEQFWSPWMVAEAPPSLVVQTSPGKHHAYWLLDKPYPLSDVEGINKRIAHNYLKVDKSGWDISQLLRLPFTKNNKYSERYDVELVEDYQDPSEKCSLDTFVTLPSVSHSTEQKQHSLPCDQDLESKEFITYKYKSLITDDHRTLMDSEGEDRSLTLWRLYHACKDIGMTREECYVIARDSPNNKFTGYRRDGNFYLWRDVCQSYHRKEAPGHVLQKVLFYINRAKNITIQERKQKVSEVVWEDMNIKGRFLVSKTENVAYFYHGKKFIKITPKSRELQVYLEIHYEINASTSYYNYVSSYLFSMASTNGVGALFATRAYFDEESNVLYVNNFDGAAWRLDGDHITLVDNGFCENIFFINDTTCCEKVVPDFTKCDNAMKDYVFSKPNFAGTIQEKETAAFFAKMWLFSLFFPELMATRPILVLEGTHGSGKTTLFKCIEWVITGSNECVKDMPLDASAFREIVRGKNHVVFDNVDQSFKGLVNLLAVIATGTKEVKRILYTDNEKAEYWLKCSVGITTMNAKFFREDVADRAIPLKVDRFEKYVSESSIKGDVLAHRSLIWGDLFNNLNIIVKNFKTMDKMSLYKLRMADFAKLIQAYCGGSYSKANYYINLMFEDQSSRQLSDNPIWDCLLPFAKDPKNQDKEWSVEQLHKRFTKYSMRNGIEYSLSAKSARKLGFELNKLAPAMNSVLLMERKKNSGKITWTFNPHY